MDRIIDVFKIESSSQRHNLLYIDEMMIIRGTLITIFLKTEVIYNKLRIRI